MHIEFVSGKKNAKISWAKLAADPTAWIEPECYPSGFLWADPSKIRKEAVLQIFDHWRQRKESGLSPIIWNPSCDILADIDRPYNYLRTMENRWRDADNSDSSPDEDFREELEAIPEDDLESHHSPSSTPPPAGTRSNSIIQPTLDTPCAYALLCTPLT